jgi:hypothetical protein
MLGQRTVPLLRWEIPGGSLPSYGDEDLAVYSPLRYCCSTVLPCSKFTQRVVAARRGIFYAGKRVPIAGIFAGKALTELYNLARDSDDVTASQRREWIRFRPLPMTLRGNCSQLTGGSSRSNCMQKSGPLSGYFVITREITRFTAECCYPAYRQFTVLAEAFRGKFDCWIRWSKLQSYRNATRSKLGKEKVCEVACWLPVHGVQTGETRVHEKRRDAVRISERIAGKLAGWFEDLSIALCCRTSETASQILSRVCRGEMMTPKLASFGR